MGVKKDDSCNSSNEDEGFNKQFMLRIMFMVSTFHRFINQEKHHSVPAERGSVIIQPKFFDFTRYLMSKQQIDKSGSKVSISDIRNEKFLS